MKCNDHNKSFKVYCETCQELICRDCPVSKRHRNHDYNLVTECYPKHHQEIEADLTKVKMKVDNVNRAMTNLITREREVTKKGEDVKKQIHTQSQLIINLVKQSERQLVQQVDTAVQQKIQLLTKQREEAEIVLKQLKGCEEFVEQSRESTTDIEGETEYGTSNDNSQSRCQPCCISTNRGGQHHIH